MRKYWFTAFIVLGLVVTVLLILLGYQSEWTGFGQFTASSTPNQVFQRQKTLWDWLGLLIIPLAIAITAIVFNQVDNRNKQKLEADREQETALQNYLERVSKLLIENNLYESASNNKAPVIARAWTLMILRRLNEERKGIVIRFLYEAELIKQTPISPALVGLREADLSLANLGSSNLQSVDLSRAMLSEANLSEAMLKDANFQDGILSQANFSYADLTNADLSNAKLFDTNLRWTNLSGAILNKADFTGADLYGAILSEVDLRDACVRKANLQSANLANAKLEGVEYDDYTKWPSHFTLPSGLIKVSP